MKIKLPVFGSLLFLTLLCSGVSAQVVNFNFTTSSGASYTGQGVYGDPGNNYWNQVGPNLDGVFDLDTFEFTTTPGAYPQNRSPMFTSDGHTQTDIRIVFDDNIPGDVFNSNDNHFSTTGVTRSFANGLFAEYHYVQSFSDGFTISGLTAGQAYELYFYAETGNDAANHAGNITLDGNTLAYSGAVLNSFVEGQNYVMFSVTPSDTTLSGTIAYDANADYQTDLSGLQIVAVETAVPEPSTYAAILGGVALAGVIGYRRRETKQTKA